MISRSFSADFRREMAQLGRTMKDHEVGMVFAELDEVRFEVHLRATLGPL